MHKELEEHEHSNMYKNENTRTENSIANYQEYIKNPQTQALLAYKFFKDDFMWHESSFKAFVISYNKHRDKQIMN